MEDALKLEKGSKDDEEDDEEDEDDEDEEDEISIDCDSDELLDMEPKL